MTVLAVGLVAVLMVAALVATALAGLVATQHRAAAAADLAALAAAARAADGGTSGHRPGDGPCALAGRVASANATELDGCELAGAVVTVEVVVEPRAPLGLRPTIRSRARAGPAELARHDAGDAR